MNTLFASNVVARLRDMATTPNIINTPIDPSLALELSVHIANIAAAVHQGDPLISRNLSLANGSLFGANAYGQAFVNPIALGQIIFAIDYIIGKQEDNSNPQGEDSAWSCIHPAIVKSSKRLYDDGHYADAAVDAFIEFNHRAKKLYKEARPDATVIPDGRDLMNKLFASTSPILSVRCITRENEQDYQEGLHLMAAGAMAALRNPKSHSNEETLTAEEAMRRLMFASMLMYQLEEASPTNIATPT